MIHSSKDKKEELKVDISSEEQVEESISELTIRPKLLKDIIGRKKEKQKISMMIDSAKKRDEVVDHILFYGPPGLGKTTFAVSIASEIGSSLHITSGPAIERQGDLAAILTNLKKNDVLFIDEIHRLSKTVEEILYPAMEDRALDIVMGKGPSAKTIRLKLQPFTLIGATTAIGKIGAPMRDRFGLILRLDYFDNEDLVEILRRAAGIWEIELQEKALVELASRSRGTARIALRLLKRVRDFAESKGVGENIDLKTVTLAFDLLGIDEFGLEDIDRKILHVMMKNFDGGPVGLSTLAASISEDLSTISDVYEPFLMKCGLMKRTARGRMLTENGVEMAMKLSDSYSL